MKIVKIKTDKSNISFKKYKAKNSYWIPEPNIKIKGRLI